MMKRLDVERRKRWLRRLWWRLQEGLNGLWVFLWVLAIFCASIGFWLAFNHAEKVMR